MSKNILYHTKQNRIKFCRFENCLVFFLMKLSVLVKIINISMKIKQNDIQCNKLLQTTMNTIRIRHWGNYLSSSSAAHVIRCRIGVQSAFKNKYSILHTDFKGETQREMQHVKIKFDTQTLMTDTSNLSVKCILHVELCFVNFLWRLLSFLHTMTRFEKKFISIALFRSMCGRKKSMSVK